MTSGRLFSATLLLLACAPGTNAQWRAGNGESSPARKRPASRPAWPRLGAGDEDRVKGLIARLGHKEPEEAARAEAALVETGTAAAPAMITRLSDGEENHNEVLERILDQVVHKEHVLLLVPYLADRRLSVRRFAAMRIAFYGNADMKPVFLGMRKDQEPEIAFMAELALARIGDQTSLPALLSAARESWSEKGAEIRFAARGLKGSKATTFLMEKLDSRDIRTELSALRLLSVVGTKECVARIGLLLESTSHLHKKEAINALRGILDGEEPLDDLSVFQAIDMAKEWKERLRGLR
jgi:HEAT repeat protein